MSSNTPGSQGAARGPFWAGSIARASPPSLSCPLCAPRGEASCPSCPACVSTGGLCTCYPPRARRPHACLSSIEDGLHRLLAESKAGVDIEQLVRVDRRASPKLAHEVPAGRTLEKGVHDLRLSYARELGTALGEALYEVLERLARLLAARPQVPGVPEAHVCALEVPHERANQVVLVVDLTGR
jgi:hypothetical protein